MHQLLLLLLLAVVASMLPIAESSFNISLDPLHVTRRPWHNASVTTSPESQSFTAANDSNGEDNETTTGEAPVTTGPPSVSFWQYQATIDCFKYGPPVLIVLATVGNILAVITLQNTMFQLVSLFEVLSPVSFQNSGVFRG